MLKPRELAQAAFDYLRRNPDEVVRAARNAAGLRFGVPVAALRYFTSQIKGRKAPKDIELSTSPPDLRFGATIDVMGTPLRATTSVTVDDVTIGTDAVRIGIRLSNMKLTLLQESDSPVATLIKSGALDLSKPANLVSFAPKKPEAIVEAEGDRIVLDLLKVPKLAANGAFRKALSIVSPLIGVRKVEADSDHVYVALRATPRGLLQAINAIRNGSNP
ncbi:hypothetical protein LVJ94_04460 [Pendulispora rubella]|uniref:Uncharacterized protein n=1 Tax=Pendulispora rubella TaxID=2741070 RepID=A0ABZ2L9L2_9BACT